MRFLFSILLLTSALFAKVTFTATASPNILPIFVMMEKGFADVDFIPTNGGMPELAAMLKGKKADAFSANAEAVKKITEGTEFIAINTNVAKAVYILSYTPIDSPKSLESLKIVSAMPGGTPDKLFQKLSLANKPTFLDVPMAKQLFLKKEFDAILLPEPHISELIGKSQGIQTYIFDLNPKEGAALNSAAILDLEKKGEINDAYQKAIEFIHASPEESAQIFARYYEKYFNAKFNADALKKALESKRLLFELKVLK